MKYAIIGAGMAGLACAETLSQMGADVVLFDKARGPGGRMSSRRVDTPQGPISFDHGAQYFTARDPAFIARVARWAREGIVAHWPAAATEAWVGVPAMNAPIREMAARQSVQWASRIEAITRSGDQWHVNVDGMPPSVFDGVVVALPAEQAAPLLLHWDADFADCAQNTRSAPCWTVMVAFAAPLATHTKVIADDEVIGWAALNSDKLGRSGPTTWVIQADPRWSEAHLEDQSEDVIAALLRRLAQRLMITLPEPLSVTAHRWRYARSGNAVRGALFNPEVRLGVCGDWLLGPRVECAWLSGTALAEKIIACR